jgi:DNA repair exonuclease SbcCD ATPase subunit
LEKYKEAEDSFKEVVLQGRLIEKSIEQYSKQEAKIAIKKQTLEEKIDDKASLVGSNCPVCGSLVTEASLQNVTSEITLEINSLDKEIAELNKLIKSESKNKAKFIKQKDKLKKDLEGKGDLEQSKDLLEEDLEEAKSNKQENEAQLKIAQARQETIIASIQEATKERDKKNVFKPLMDSAKAQIKSVNTEISSINTDLKLKNKDLQEYDAWVRAYGNQGIKSYLLDAITPYLNERANYYLQKLTSNSIEVIFSTQTKLKSGETRDKFSIEVSNKYGGGKFKANSGGERKRVDIAVNMALQDLVATRSSKRLNIVVFDEVFDAMDNIGIEHTVELLQENINGKSTIFVTTHNSELKSYFDNSITFQKENGFTSLIEE